MASIEEQETHILINKADLREGYFRFTTSSAVDFKRLVNRIGGESKLLELTVHGKTDEETGKKHITEWIAKVPAEYISLTTFGIRIKRSYSEEVKKQFTERINKVRVEKLGHGS